MNASDAVLTLETFQDSVRQFGASLTRATLITRGPDGEQAIDLPVQRIEFDTVPRYSFGSMAFDEGRQLGGWGCPCAACAVERGEIVRQPAYRLSALFAPDDAAAATSLQALLGDCQPHEVLAARDALRAGRMWGASRESCLIAYLAHARGQDYSDLKRGLSGLLMPDIEQWVIVHISPLTTPANDKHAALLDTWLTDWLDTHTLELAAAPVAVST